MTTRRDILRSAVISGAGVGLGVASVARSASGKPPAQLPKVSTERNTAAEHAESRAKAVLTQMTLAEKLSLLSGTSGMLAKRANPTELRIGAGHVPGVARLGIPDLWETDASLGVAYAGGLRAGDVATALPSSLATAATFDPELAYAGGAIIGAEARAKGFNVLLAGGANLIRDPWGGRAFEYLSEDVLLTGVQAGAGISGVQSNGIASTLKHFALNPQESGRYVLDAKIEQAALHESDLLAFEIALERGKPASVMAAYNKVNGDWASENAYLLTTVLRDDWAYDGWVMSDWGSVHSAEKAALAGLDQQSGRDFDKEPFFEAPLTRAVESGGVPESLIDEKVLRILRQMFRLGLVDDPAPAVPEAIDYSAHGEVAQRIAEAGMVLLKNQRGLLPLAEHTPSIAIIGGHADIGVLSGGGSSLVCSVGGFALQIPQEGVGPFAGLMTRCYHNSSPLQAMQARCPKARIAFDDGLAIDRAVELARTSSVAIVFAEEWRTEVLDQQNLNLSRDQENLILAVARSNPRTIVVLQSGGPVLMPWVSEVGAILQAWYPGQRGGQAIARVLLGDVDPSGRLPVTFPAALSQVPRPQIPGLAEAKAAFERVAKASLRELGSIGLAGGQESFPVEYHEAADAGYRWYVRQGNQPAFPFGYGLSYTSFTHTRLELDGRDRREVHLNVANVGKRRGVDVAQVYGVADGVPRLIGFRRTELDPGEEKRITIPLDLRPLQRFDLASRKRLPVSGRFPFYVGRSVLDPTLHGTLSDF